MILQFGAGNFLRGFADVFVHELDQHPDGAGIGPVVVVQSTGRERADLLNEAGGKYHLVIQGYRDGQVVEETHRIDAIFRALHAGSEWEGVLTAASAPELVAILSNTTEAGLALDDADQFPGAEVPRSFPAKLLAVLAARQAVGLPGPWIVPCELIESNGDRLRELVAEQARRWQLSDDLLAWLTADCRWVNTLVDRIVPGPPKAHPLLGTDPLLISAEPYALWAVETEAPDFPFARHPAVVLSTDIRPYTLRKVRLLNGAHSALVMRAAGRGLATVRACLEDPETGAWLEGLLFEEIVPVLEGRCENPAGFAREVLDRFRNPFLEHRLSAIALNHEAKVAVRLEPTLREYRERFGKDPERLAAVMKK
jgi:tagaturonate reductase